MKVNSNMPLEEFGFHTKQQQDSKLYNQIVSELHSRVGGFMQFLYDNEKLFAVVATTLIMSMCHTALSPILPLYAKEFGVGTAMVSLTLSVYAAARLMVNLPAGVIGDAIGRKPLLIFGPFVTSMGMLGSGLSRSFVELLVWRFVTGVGSAIQMTGAQLYLADISTTGDRARKMGTNQAAALLGVSIGPAIGGILADKFGLRAPFLAMTIMAVVAGVYGAIRLEETKSKKACIQEQYQLQTESQQQVLWALLKSDNFRSIALVNASIFMTANGGRSILMPLLGVADFGYSPGHLGYLFSLMAIINMVFIIPASFVADQYGRKYSIIPSGVGLAVSLITMAFSSTQIVYAFSALFYGFCNAFLGSAPVAYATDVMPTAKRGLGLGIYRCAGDMGLMLGPAMLGVVADRSTTREALQVNALVLLLAILYFAFRAQETMKNNMQTQLGV
eukprot:TRINITY_DN16405_c0_g3_i2.p1 TRINITY_DN16405_c0_g3~~TRINITY_DN16405_c0_g3_i2.p1  ORF type:complete len:446 (+),score=31.60 TRINITY_DN16405_c0_g3_i2:193-1530(+)